MAIEKVTTIAEYTLKIVRNRVFDCHLSPDWRQMTMKTLFLAMFDSRSSIVKSVFDCRLLGVSNDFTNISKDLIESILL